MSVGPLHSGSFRLRWTPTKNLVEKQMVGHKIKILLTPTELQVDLREVATTCLIKSEGYEVQASQTRDSKRDRYESYSSNFGLRTVQTLMRLCCIWE